MRRRATVRGAVLVLAVTSALGVVAGAATAAGGAPARAGAASAAPAPCVNVPEGRACLSRVSVSSQGTQGDEDSRAPALTPTGSFLVFQSFATNLVPADTNGWTDVFLRAQPNGSLSRTSVADDGTEGSLSSISPEISANGRYVTFESPASNLDPADTDSSNDVFLRDRTAGTTRLVAVSSDEEPADRPSTSAVMSDDGRYIAFVSSAHNLVPGPVDDMQVYLRDRVAGTTSLVSVSDSQAAGNGASLHPAMSPDGRFVVFESVATNLVPGDTNNRWDVFVRDRQLGTTERVSLRSSGGQGNACCEGHRPAISADGRFVAFRSLATNLVPGDTNGTVDVFVRDRLRDTTRRVSVRSNGAQATGESEFGVPGLSMSGDGRYVGFVSGATNLVPGDTNRLRDVFVHDRSARTTRRMSVSRTGAQAVGGHSADVRIARNGRHVAFASRATNLVPGDDNGSYDVFLWTITPR